LFSGCITGHYDTIANTARAKYSNLSNDTNQNEVAQCEILSAIAKLACSGSHCLQSSEASLHNWKTLNCTLCDVESDSDRDTNVYWNDKCDSEDWKDALAAMLVITKEPKFQASAKARVQMAVAIGRVFNHISDVDYLSLEICELGQWLLGSMSRSLRELKIAAT
jgi:serine/threonine-protein kinase ATR